MIERPWQYLGSFHISFLNSFLWKMHKKVSGWHKKLRPRQIRVFQSKTIQYHLPNKQCLATTSDLERSHKPDAPSFWISTNYCSPKVNWWAKCWCSETSTLKHVLQTKTYLVLLSKNPAVMLWFATPSLCSAAALTCSSTDWTFFQQ